ncbi:MAG: ABC transporter ATP-binding protein [Rhodospirillales bacterium]|nr:ABC transporter ATP-binding protein [Rhodospirillales bacterium]
MALSTSSPASGLPGVTLQGDFSHQHQVLFRDLELRVEAAEWTCLLGPSGVGKSTLLRLLAGLETGGAFTGTIDTDDHFPLQGRVAYMGQADLLAPWLNIHDNVLLGARLRGSAPDHGRAETLIARVGLADHTAKRPAALSGGMRQRVALARALMEDRPFVLLDEPFAALDAKTRAEMQELAFELLAGRTVLLVTHDPSEAARLGHHILIMTANGLNRHPTPSRPPIRPYDAPETLAAQIALMSQLRSQPDA